MAPNYEVVTGLRKTSKIYIHENHRYSYQKKVAAGYRLRCCRYNHDPPCHGAALLSFDEQTITANPKCPHHHVDSNREILAAEFKNTLTNSILDRQTNVKQLYDDLVTIWSITRHPDIGQIVPFTRIESTLNTVRRSFAAQGDECPICLEGKTPLTCLVGCGHTYCGPCAQALLDGTQICSVCQNPFFEIQTVY